MTSPRLAVFAALLSAAAAAGQDAPPLRLDGMAAPGPRLTVTNKWDAFKFTVSSAGSPREARVLAFYAGRPDAQFGRDVWVPADSALTSWLPLGPAAADGANATRELKFQLIDRTGGADAVVLPGGDERLRSRLLRYGKSSAVLMTDDLVTDTLTPDALSRPETAAAQASLFARMFRVAMGQSQDVTIFNDRFLPPTPEALDGADLFVLAGNRLTGDPVGARTLRRWVQRGGTLWVMLDHTDPATVAPILGDDLLFSVADRTSLSFVRLLRAGDVSSKEAVREFDVPVGLARVRLGGPERALFTVDGWPAAFSQPLGRGRVLFTTLGGRAWSRPRTAKDPPRQAMATTADAVAPTTALERLAFDLFPEPTPAGLTPADLDPLVSSEIGYQVPTRRTAGLILGGFVLAVVGLGVALRRTRRPEVIGWLVPAAAAAAAAAFFVLGTAARQAVPPTVGWAAVADVTPGVREAAVTGVAAVYRPASGPVTLTAADGGLLDLNAEGLDGQSRRLIQTDADTRAWENLALPAGVRTGTFRGALPTGPVAAVARFGPAGVAGTFTAGNFPGPQDAVIFGPAGAAYSPRLSAAGDFSAGPADELPPGQFVTGGEVTDRQQRRQDVYRKLLSPVPRHMAGRPYFLAWADATTSPVSAVEGERKQGTVLLAVPVEFERPAAGTRVTVPAGFIPYRPAAGVRLTMDSTSVLNQAIRFQLPPSVMPLAVDRATLILRVRAPGRKLTVTGEGGVTLHRADSPAGEIRIDIADAKLRAAVGAGEPVFTVGIGEQADPAANAAEWKIEAIGLEVSGTTSGTK